MRKYYTYKEVKILLNEVLRLTDKRSSEINNLDVNTLREYRRKHTKQHKIHRKIMKKCERNYNRENAKPMPDQRKLNYWHNRRQAHGVAAELHWQAKNKSHEILRGIAISQGKVNRKEFDVLPDEDPNWHPKHMYSDKDLQKTSEAAWKATNTLKEYEKNKRIT